MKLNALLAVAAVALFVTGPLVSAEKDAPTGVCPVKDKPAVKCPLEYNGGTIKFCCPNCFKAFKEDPAKYAARANHQLVATKQAKLKRCVFTCKELDPSTVIEVAGVKICFCCEKCKEKVQGAGDQVECAFNDKQFKNGYEVAPK